MPNQKNHEFTKNLDKCYNIVLQSSAKGISAVEIAKKLGKHRTTIHGYLNTLEYMGRVESQHGIWRVKTGEQTIKPLEKEIVIELPMPKNQWQRMALLEALRKDWEGANLPEDGNIYRILLEKFRETRTIRIKGKNVDDLDLEKLGNLIQQANEKSSKVNLKGMLKSLKRSHANNP
jgi:IS30 family transposase